MKIRQRSVSASDAEEASATNHDLRQPIPLAAIHRKAAGNGKSAHIGFLIGQAQLERGDRREHRCSSRADCRNPKIWRRRKSPTP